MTLPLVPEPRGPVTSPHGVQAGCPPLAVPEPGPFRHVETLYLPEPGQPSADCDLVGACTGRQSSAPHFDFLLGDRWMEPAQFTPDRLYWGRWILAHQLSFITWRLLGQALGRLSAALSPAGSDTEVLVARVVELTELHSLLFMYAGSCPPEVYVATIRPAMARQHPAFTGQWARDYWPIPVLLRSLQESAPAEVTGPVDSAVRFNHQVHRAVGARLVPDEKSLWKASEHEDATSAQSADLADGFDCYFTTVRRPVCSASVLAQYLRRLGQAAADLRTHGLYGAAAPPISAFVPSPERERAKAMEYEAEELLRRAGRAVWAHAPA
ncbi:hypothetical protein ACGFYV_19415 [Streptomyces sp. NPDC048297]|uniref:hypothetical protein n=1 Tax=Streptomyces sp. NPDC048297 TaxID=3365531 RepID=UPI00371B578D